ncbi:MAG: hypothetical protein O7H41_17585 [Planctomycetota bacterium]|nr:hypothetical protein [Planctomycetota bacterium]
MQYRSSHIAAILAVVFIALPLLAFAQEPPAAEKQTPKDQPPKPRLDLYRDPLPEALEEVNAGPLIFDGRPGGGRMSEELCKLMGASVSSPRPM